MSTIDRDSKMLESARIPEDILRRSDIEVPPAALHVKIKGGSKLYKTSPFHKIDPYVIVEFGRNSSRSITQLRAGSDCQFDWSVTFPFNPNKVTEEKYLKLSVWDQHLCSKDDEVGHCTMDSKTILKFETRECAFRNKVELTHIGRVSGREKMGGFIDVEVYWENHSVFMDHNEGTEIILQSLRSVTNPIVELPIPTLFCVTNFNHASGALQQLIDDGTIMSYSPFRTYNVRLWHVDMVFQGYRKGWNRDYKAAQQIYGNTHGSKMLRLGLQMQNYMAYSNDFMNSDHLVHEIVGMESFESMLQSCHVKDAEYSEFPSQLNKCPRYTYVIMPDSHMHFSVTSKKLAMDFLSKHALHAGGAEEVVYSGEFFFDANSPRALEAGTALIIDNNSGTFGPPKEKLCLLQLLMQLNFGTKMHVIALDRDDPYLRKLKDLNNVE